MSSYSLSGGFLMFYRISDDEYVKKHIQLVADENIEDKILWTVSC